MTGESVLVSMYNVGFGDCFLLTFPGPDRRRRVLIDCGSIKRGAAGSTDGIVEQIIEDVTENGTAHIDVVAVSHRHKDHVSGFDHEAWQDVVVDEVWLPWTEDPSNPRARQILKDMASFAGELSTEVAALDDLFEAERGLVTHVIENTIGLSNDKAMATLLRGFRAGKHGTKRVFLSRSAEPLLSATLPGVTVHRLGPSEDEDVIRDMNPPSRESFLRAVRPDAANGQVTADQRDTDELLPFEAVEPQPWMWIPGDLKNMLRRMSLESTILGAVALERAVNNTSLMLVFEVGEAVLFFPGDAQWGSWAVNLEDEQTRELLKRTTFYKVGHHGSHNATPVTFVEDIFNSSPSSEVMAAASVAPHRRFEEIPKDELMARLEDKIEDPQHLIRSDQPPLVGSIPDAVSVATRDGVATRIDFEIPVRP